MDEQTLKINLHSKVDQLRLSCILALEEGLRHQPGGSSLPGVN